MESLRDGNISRIAAVPGLFISEYVAIDRLLDTYAHSYLTYQ